MWELSLLCVSLAAFAAALTFRLWCNRLHACCQCLWRLDWLGLWVHVATVYITGAAEQICWYVVTCRALSALRCLWSRTAMVAQLWRRCWNWPLLTEAARWQLDGGDMCRPKMGMVTLLLLPGWASCATPHWQAVAAVPVTVAVLSGLPCDQGTLSSLAVTQVLSLGRWRLCCISI